MTDTATPPQRLYEGMFLMSQQTLSAGLGEAMDYIRQILDRAGAELVSLSKWDDRKLAYPINGQKRGTFMVALFHVDGVQIANIERDCNLGENVLRVLITAADHLGETEIDLARQDAEKSQAEAALTRKDEEPAAKPVAAPAEESIATESDR